jgi:hypothetical protein
MSISTKPQTTLSKKSVTVASPPPGHRKQHTLPMSSSDSAVSSPTPVAVTRSGTEAVRSFSSVFWNLIFSATGFKREHLDVLRETSEDVFPTHDVVELAAPDVSWADASAIQALRSQLQSYVESLRALKTENAKQLRSRPFVEQKRYEAMRSRELAGRVTAASVMRSFTRLNMSNRRLETISEEDIAGFQNVKELVLSRNALRFLDAVPPSVQVLVASGNSIEMVEGSALERCQELYVVGLSSNRIQDISFMLFSSSVVSLDVSYNPISSLEDVLEVLKGHPSLRDINFEGCPVSFSEGYRASLIAACPQLVTIDGISVVRDDASELPATAAAAAAPTMAASASSLPTAAQSPRKVVGIAASANVVAPLTLPSGGGELLPLGSALKSSTPTIGPPTLYVQFVAIRGVQVLQPEKDLSENRLPSAGGKKPAPPPKKGAAKVAVEEERGPQSQLVFNLTGSWNSALAVSVQDVDVLPPPPVVDDPKAAKASAAVKGGKNAAAAVVPDAATVPVLDAEAAIKVPPLESILDQPAESLDAWMAPLLLDLELADYLVAPVTGTPTGNVVSPNTPDLPGASPQQPPRALQSSQWLGTFVVPVFDSLVELNQQRSSGCKVVPKQLLIPLTPQRNTLAQVHTQIKQRKQALVELIEDDQKLDAILAEIVTAEMDAPPPTTAQSPPPPTKGKAPSKQAAAPVKALSEATVAKQQESAARKLSIEESGNVIKDEEKKLERLSKADKLTLVLQISLNAPIVVEVKQAEVAVAPTPAAAAGKKK